MEKRLIRTLTILVFLSVLTNVLLFSYKRETTLSRVNFKMLVEDEDNPGTYIEETGNVFPSNKYVLSDYECDNGGSVEQDPISKKLMFTGNANNCNLTFDISVTPAEATLSMLQALNSSITPNSGTPDFTTTATTDEGLFEGEDDYGLTYYFRGNPTKNYIKFADFYWRIVRINGDGSLRLIYDGASPDAKGNIGSSAYNSSSNSNAYVGYMYGSGSTYDSLHSNGTSSRIKYTVLDTWYADYIKDKAYENYISDTIFCGDRTLSSGTGIGTTVTMYKPQERIFNAKEPSLLCERQLDKYTADDTTNGNGALTYPIGLITADEIAFAGAVQGKTNSNIYLNRGTAYWTMSPNGYIDSSSTNPNANVIYSASGTVYRSAVTTSRAVIPVINLKQDALTITTGTGTKTDPFIVDLPSEMPDNLKTLNKLRFLNSNIKVNSTIPDFSKSTTSGEGLYKAEDDYGSSYYYRGAATKNYVKFANFYWRIVRINGNGSLRLYYEGTTATEKGNIGRSSYNNLNGQNNASVGYMYGNKNATTYADAHANTNNSTIKTKVDTWYENNILNTSFEQYVSDTEFCNDRSLQSGNGYGTQSTKYKAYDRLVTNKAPILTCPQKNDRFTVNDTTLGNGALTYPIGLITADEVAMSGNVLTTANTSSFLYRPLTSTYTGSPWTMTPYGSEPYYATSYHGSSFLIMSQGASTAYGEPTYDLSLIIPVINITPEAVQTMTGKGTSSNPFVVN